MSEKGNIRAVDKYLEALNAHDYAGLSAHHGKGFQYQGPGMTVPGDESVHRAFMEQNWAALPDLTFQDTHTIADGDYVVKNWVATGTHNGPLVIRRGNTLPATGRKVTLRGSHTMEFRNGKIVRVDAFFDSMDLLAGIGAVPGVQS